MGVIRVLGMEFVACHGVHPEEKTKPQRFEVDVEISLDLSSSSASDCLEDTVDYSRIVSSVREALEGEPCNLLERLAGKILDRIAEFAPGGNATVRVRKPNAPLSTPFRTVEVELEKEFKK